MFLATRNVKKDRSVCMAIYCMSDIHGHKTEFMRMLKQIGFSSADTMYVLGDIIDKGTESAEMLVYAIEEAPSNIRFLLGNHEDMMAHVLASCMGEWPSPRLNDTWSYNGGVMTLFQAEDIDEIGESWFYDKAYHWVKSLPLYEKVIVNGKKFLLVHAGVNPLKYENRDKNVLPALNYECDGNWEEESRRELINIDWGYGNQYSQDMLWERARWLSDPVPAPTDIVFGHTYLNGSFVNFLRENNVSVEGGSGYIAHLMGNKHDIDCGCSQNGNDGCDHDDCDYYRLACLRLDDMSEYYENCIDRRDEYV